MLRFGWPEWCEIRTLVAESSIDIVSVPHDHDENQEYLFSDLVQNTIVTDAQAVKLILAFDLLYSLRIRIRPSQSIRRLILLRMEPSRALKSRCALGANLIR